MQKHSNISPRYFNSEIDIDLMLWVLSDNDITKVPTIKDMLIVDCYNWYYNSRVKELNEMIGSLEQLKEAKSD